MTDLSIYTMGIPIAFVILGAMACWIIVGAKGHWALKVFFVAVAMFCFSVAVWHSVENLLGLPSKKGLPEKFEVIWMNVEQPKRREGDPGAIYFWVKHIETDEEEETGPFARKMPNEPLSFKAPYSKELHEQAQQVQAMLKMGMRVQGNASGGMEGEPGQGADGAGDGKGGKRGFPGEKGDGKGKGDGMGSFSKKQDFVFHILPPGKLPEK
jgi:hypothetical protein